MKTLKILYKIIILMMVIVMFNSCICYAAPPSDVKQEIFNDGGGGTPPEDPVGGTGGGTGGGTTGAGLPSLDGLDPVVNLGSETESILETILGALIIIGAICMVISIALIGFNIMLGSADQKAAGQEKCVGLFVAAALICGTSSIAKLFISIAGKL